MALTQANVDDYLNKYFRALDANGDEIDWPTNTLSTALAGGYKAKVGSLSQPIQDDLVALLDELTTLIV